MTRIAALDDDFAEGKLEEAEYRRQRKQLKDALLKQSASIKHA